MPSTLVTFNNQSAQAYNPAPGYTGGPQQGGPQHGYTSGPQRGATKNDLLMAMMRQNEQHEMNRQDVERQNAQHEMNRQNNRDRNQNNLNLLLAYNTN